MSHRHFILHKPIGYLSQFIYSGKRKSRMGLLGSLYDFPEGTMAIGRLDRDSEGLIFLTTDGKVSEEVRSSKFEKEYFVQVQGIISDEAINLMVNGVGISHKSEVYVTKKAKVRRIFDLTDIPFKVRQLRSENHGPTSWVAITIKEGKYRQVRKMTAIVGYPTLQLGRVRIGEVFLDIPVGGVKEVASFY